MGAALAVVILLTGLYAGAYLTARRRLPLRPPLWSAPPPVSVLKPVRGCDAGAEANFRTFFCQDYPAPYELIFAVESDSDPAVPVLRRLMAEHPGVEARLVLAPPRPDLTGKMANVAAAYRHARHDVIVVSDSDMRAAPDFLHRLVSPLRDSTVALVGTLPVYTAATTLWARALQVYAHLFALCFGAVIADADLPGKFAAGNQAMRRELVEALGGFEAIGGYLTEDVRLSQAARASGGRVVFGAMAEAPVGPLALPDLLDTLTRYLFGSRAMSLPLYAFTCLLNQGHWLVPAAGILAGEPLVWALGLVTVLTRALVAWRLHVRWVGPVSFTSTMTAAVALDAAFLVAAARVLLRRPVRWRNVLYQVAPDGRVQRLDAAAAMPRTHLDG